MTTPRPHRLGSTPAPLPLFEGDRGDAVADVQRRLQALGFGLLSDEQGLFGPATRAALEAFQHHRGLRVDGICGAQTWNTLVEAGFALGDRFIYRRRPYLRGDDVATLQQYLSALGFDPGRVDGIFGDQTGQALREFQRNVGLPMDGICGAETLLTLRRLQAPHHPHNLVSTVRARERLRQTHHRLSGSRVAVGEQGGLSQAVAGLRRQLSAAGARVVSLHHPDGSSQAQQANRAGVDVYVGLRLEPDREGCSTAYYSGYRDESPGGQSLARLVQKELPPALGIPDRGVRGMSVPVLRETRMPAIIVELGPAPVMVERGRLVADVLTRSLACWAEAPWE